jgi:hypothetical protein
LSEAEAQAIANALISENIKKGWEEVVAPPTKSRKQTGKKLTTKS